MTLATGNDRATSCRLLTVTEPGDAVNCPANRNNGLGTLFLKCRHDNHDQSLRMRSIVNGRRLARNIALRAEAGRYESDTIRHCRR